LEKIDSYQTDQICFSEIVKLFTSHPAKLDSADSVNGAEQISILEKFVTKAIEQEKSQQKIMSRVHEGILEESKQEFNEENVDQELSDSSPDVHQIDQRFGNLHSEEYNHNNEE
jgi:hypothetical protein